MTAGMAVPRPFDGGRMGLCSKEHARLLAMGGDERLDYSSRDGEETGAIRS